jgi:anaerobic selenocysteine-containing dehydrogenase
VPQAPAVQFADLTFATPSGRIEIASAALASLGLPRVPSAGAEARPQGAGLRLLSPAHDWLMNTSFGNVARIEARIGAARIALHPVDAAQRGVQADQLVRVHNATGEITLRVAIDPTLPRGVALSHKGRWMGPGAGGANINVLNDGRKTDLGESSAVHSVEVEVSPFAAAPA